MTDVSGLVYVPASALNVPQLSPFSVELSRVTVRVEVSRPDSESAPSVSENETDAAL